MQLQPLLSSFLPRVLTSSEHDDTAERIEKVNRVLRTSKPFSFPEDLNAICRKSVYGAYIRGCFLEEKEEETLRADDESSIVTPLKEDQEPKIMPIEPLRLVTSGGVHVADQKAVPRRDFRTYLLPESSLYALIIGSNHVQPSIHTIMAYVFDVALRCQAVRTAPAAAIIAPSVGKKAEAVVEYIAPESPEERLSRSLLFAAI